MPALHGARKQHASEFARGNRRQRTLKEDPNVAAFSRTRTFQGRGHVQLPARLQESQGVILPRRLVKVCREKPARFIWQESVYADGFLAQEVVLDDGVGQRKELPGLLVDFLSFLRSSSDLRNQHVSSGRRAYTPMVSLPKRWSSMTASVSGRNFRVFWSTFFRSSGRLLLMAFQSFTTAGIYPCRPSAFSHRRA